MEDLLPRCYEATGRPARGGKLTPDWEGPYKVTEIVRPGTYKLQNIEGFTLKRSWNVCNLWIF